MKKIKQCSLLLLMVVFLIAFAGCSKNATRVQPTDDAIKINGTEKNLNDEHIETIHVTADPPYFENLDNFVSSADAIIVGEVTNITYERIDKVEKGLVESSEPYYSNLTRYTINVKEVISGGFSIGNIITVDQTGGLADGVNLVIEGASYMETANEYLMFLRQPEVAQGKGYCENMLLSVQEGFCLVLDGKVIPLAENRLITAPTQYAEIARIVQECVK